MDLTSEWRKERDIRVIHQNNTVSAAQDRSLLRQQGRKKRNKKNQPLSKGCQNLLEKGIWFYCQFYENKMEEPKNFHANISTISGISKMHKYSSGE